jgi:hypothetical protein
MAGTPYIDNNVIKQAREGSTAHVDQILGPDGLPLTVGNGNKAATTPMPYSASPSASPGIQQHPSTSSYPLQSTPGLPPVASSSGSLPLPAPSTNGSSSSSAGLLPHPNSSYTQPVPQNYPPNHMMSAPSSARTSPQRATGGAEDARMEMD